MTAPDGERNRWDAITGYSDIPAWDELTEEQREDLEGIGYGPLSYPHYVEEYKEWYAHPNANENLYWFFNRLQDQHFGGHGNENIEHEFEQRRDMDALRAQLAERDALLLKGCNLINYSVSGMSVPILDWTRYIAECRALLGDAYREYDARGE